MERVRIAGARTIWGQWLGLWAGLALLAAAVIGPALVDTRLVFAPVDLVATAVPGVSSPPQQVGNGLLGDPVYQVIPWRQLAGREWAAGRLPLWNDQQLLGTPLLGNLQSAVFSPWSLLGALVGPVPGLAWLAWLKLLLAGGGMGLFLGRLGLRPGAVAAGAVSFMLCSHMVGWLQWTIAEVFLLGPWLLWLGRGWLNTGGGGWLLGWAAGLALGIVGGHIESAFNITVLAVAYVGMGLLTRAWAERKSRGAWMELGRSSAGWIGASVLGLGLAAAQLLPFVALLPDSLQAADRVTLAAQRAYLPPEAILTWLVPNLFGNPAHDLYWGRLNYNEATGYAGLIALALAPLALWRRPRAESLFWLAAAVVSAGMAWHVPILGLLNELPGFSLSLAYRLHALAEIAVVVLGALGLDQLLRARPQRVPRPLRVALGVAAAGILLGGLALHSTWYTAPHPTAQAAYQLAWIGWAAALLGGLALVVAAWSGGWVGPRGLAGGLLVLTVLDGGRFAWGYNGAVPTAQFYPATPFTAALAAQPGRGAVLGPEVQANLNTAYGWRDYRAYDPMLDNRHKRWVRLMSRGTYHGETAPQYATPMNLLPPRPDMFSAIGLAWVAARDPLDPNALPPEPIPGPPPPAGPAFTRSATIAGFGLWQNRYARPFAYFAGHIQLLADGEAVWQFYRNSPGTGWDLTLVEGAPPLLADLAASHTPEAPPESSPALLAVGAGTVQVMEQRPGRIELQVARPDGQSGLLVVNESWAAGWQATVDDQAVPILRANYLAQAVVVPGGSHRVVLVYQPVAVTVGLLLSAGSLLALVGLATLLLFRRARPRPQAGRSAVVRGS